MDLVASFIAWLDWQSDAHLEWTAMVAVRVVQNDATGEEQTWWAAHPVRTRALVDACWRSGLCNTDWPTAPDFDVRDLRNYTNVDYGRTWCEVRWTLNRLRDRRWGIIP